VDGSLSRVRVFIMSDMEGIAGVTKWAETTAARLCTVSARGSTPRR
jgi:hypothetical protein